MPKSLYERGEDVRKSKSGRYDVGYPDALRSIYNPSGGYKVNLPYIVKPGENPDDYKKTLPDKVIPGQDTSDFIKPLGTDIPDFPMYTPINPSDKNDPANVLNDQVGAKKPGAMDPETIKAATDDMLDNKGKGPGKVDKFGGMRMLTSPVSIDNEQESKLALQNMGLTPQDSGVARFESDGRVAYYWLEQKPETEDEAQAIKYNKIKDIVSDNLRIQQDMWKQTERKINKIRSRQLDYVTQFLSDSDDEASRQAALRAQLSIEQDYMRAITALEGEKQNYYDASYQMLMSQYKTPNYRPTDEALEIEREKTRRAESVAAMRHEGAVQRAQLQADLRDLGMYHTAVVQKDLARMKEIEKEWGEEDWSYKPADYRKRVIDEYNSMTNRWNDEISKLNAAKNNVSTEGPKPSAPRSRIADPTGDAGTNDPEKVNAPVQKTVEMKDVLGLLKGTRTGPGGKVDKEQFAASFEDVKMPAPQSGADMGFVGTAIKEGADAGVYDKKYAEMLSQLIVDNPNDFSVRWIHGIPLPYIYSEGTPDELKKKWTNLVIYGDIGKRYNEYFEKAKAARKEYMLNKPLKKVGE